MPACGKVHKALQELTGLSSTGNVVHKDPSEAGVKRDTKDIQAVIAHLKERKPFSRNNKELNSLSSGIIGEGSVNFDSAKAVGNSILPWPHGRESQYHSTNFPRKITFVT